MKNTFNFLTKYLTICFFFILNLILKLLKYILSFNFKIFNKIFNILVNNFIYNIISKVCNKINLKFYFIIVKKTQILVEKIILYLKVKTNGFNFNFFKKPLKYIIICNYLIYFILNKILNFKIVQILLFNVNNILIKILPYVIKYIKYIYIFIKDILNWLIIVFKILIILYYHNKYIQALKNILKFTKLKIYIKQLFYFIIQTPFFQNVILRTITLSLWGLFYIIYITFSFIIWLFFLDLWLLEMIFKLIYDAFDIYVVLKFLKFTIKLINTYIIFPIILYEFEFYQNLNLIFINILDNNFLPQIIEKIYIYFELIYLRIFAFFFKNILSFIFCNFYYLLIEIKSNSIMYLNIKFLIINILPIFYIIILYIILQIYYNLANICIIYIVNSPPKLKYFFFNYIPKYLIPILIELFIAIFLDIINSKIYNYFLKNFLIILKLSIFEAIEIYTQKHENNKYNELLKNFLKKKAGSDFFFKFIFNLLLKISYYINFFFKYDFLLQISIIFKIINIKIIKELKNLSIIIQILIALNKSLIISIFCNFVYYWFKNFIFKILFLSLRSFKYFFFAYNYIVINKILFITILNIYSIYFENYIFFFYIYKYFIFCTLILNLIYFLLEKINFLTFLILWILFPITPIIYLIIFIQFLITNTTIYLTFLKLNYIILKDNYFNLLYFKHLIFLLKVFIVFLFIFNFISFFLIYYISYIFILLWFFFNIFLYCFLKEILKHLNKYFSIIFYENLLYFKSNIKKIK